LETKNKVFLLNKGEKKTPKWLTWGGGGERKVELRKGGKGEKGKTKSRILTWTGARDHAFGGKQK